MKNVVKGFGFVVLSLVLFAVLTVGVTLVITIGHPNNDDVVHEYLEVRQAHINNIAREMNDARRLSVVAQECRTLENYPYPDAAYDIYRWTNIECGAIMQFIVCQQAGDYNCVVTHTDMTNYAAWNIERLQEGFNWPSSQVSYISLDS